jgi:phosphoribosylformimino-5-aminoimidazole carboxamide ribotide isomerase
MRIVPVLDVMHGEVVRGVGGRREHYRPIVSRLTTSSRPLDVAHALVSHFGCRELYVADLDAIRGGEPSWALYATLHAQGYDLWVDAGIQRMQQAHQLADEGIESIVVGLETVAGPDELANMIEAYGERIVFSLDLRQCEPLGEREVWQNSDASGIAAQVVSLGIRRLLVLDLARVGGNGGTGTYNLCSLLSANYPHVSLSAGGGVRNRGDLEELRDCGVQAALVASALHDGRLTRADIDDLSRP